MTITKDVNGILCNDFMQKRKITVRITKDSKGKTISLADEKENVMLIIPLEPIEENLKQILR